MNPKPLKEIVDWIIANRKGKAFKDYSKEKIESEIYESIFFCIFLIAIDEDNNITGVVCGDRDINKKQIFIHDILTTKKGTIELFIKECYSRFPNYTLYGNKKTNKLRTFKTKQLMESLN